MSLNDTLAAVLSNIMNSERNGKKEVLVRYNSKLIKKLLSMLQENKYLGSFEEIEDGKNKLLKISLLGNINKIGVVKPRFSVTKQDFVKFEKRFLPAKDMGLLLLSTNKGLLTHTQAKQQGIGGKLLCYCY